MAKREIWKQIPGHKGYEASNLGRIRSIDRWVKFGNGNRFWRGRILRQYTLWSGYKTTHLGKAHVNRYIHHLICLAFRGKTPEGLEIRHYNDNKNDNKLANLKFGTRAANNTDRLRNGIRRGWYGSQNSRQRRQGESTGTMDKRDNR